MFYESQRYIGRLNREIRLSIPRSQLLPISLVTNTHLNPADVLAVFRSKFKPKDVLERVAYKRTSQCISLPDMLRICVSFNISHKRTARLSEEVVAGTIVA